MENKQAKIASGMFILNLVIGIFAFAFILGSIGFVGAQNFIPTPGGEGFVAGGSGSGGSGFIDPDITDEPSGKYFFDDSPSNLKKLSATPNPTNVDEKGFIGKNMGYQSDKLQSSFTTAAIGIGAGFAIKQFLGDEPWGAALGNAVTAGSLAMSAATLFAGSSGKFLGLSAGPWGLIVGAIVFILTYKDVEQETVFFTCQPWEAPIGGNDCEICNDGLEPCSEYRCKSLGQACELVNPGTDRELCVWVSPKDVNSPAIKPHDDFLTVGYQYVPLGARPPSWGVNIKPSGEDCIPAFTPIQFGIETDKPAQCKIDFLIKEGGGQAGGAEETSSTTRGVNPLGFDEMEFFFGGSNLFDYNHTQALNLPSPNTVNRIGELNVAENGELEIRNDGEYSMYVRCKSANGFYNADPYAIEFCVDDGPDLTPPLIEETSIRDGQPVNFGADNITLSVFTNEPANCRWERSTDLRFEDMNNEMVCANGLQDIKDNLLYECRTTLTGIKDRESNLFFFRCEDQPWEEVNNRNRMQAGKPFTVIGTEPLNIREGSVVPELDSVVSGATSTITVKLGVETQNGYQEGAASCLYSTDNETYIRFFETGTHLHRQNQDLTNGEYTYYYQCIDLGGNLAQTSTTFDVFVDTQPPSVVRVLNDGRALKVVTNEDAICRYSTDPNVQCNFEVNEGEGTPMQHVSSDKKTEHLADWNLDQTYYIKCADGNGKEPLNTQCSIIVRPVELADA
jgi:hypothetical protein